MAEWPLERQAGPQQERTHLSENQQSSGQVWGSVQEKAQICPCTLEGQESLREEHVGTADT